MTISQESTSRSANIGSMVWIVPSLVSCVVIVIDRNALDEDDDLNYIYEQEEDEEFVDNEEMEWWEYFVRPCPMPALWEVYISACSKTINQRAESSMNVATHELTRALPLDIFS